LITSKRVIGKKETPRLSLLIKQSFYRNLVSILISCLKGNDHYFSRIALPENFILPLLLFVLLSC